VDSRVTGEVGGGSNVLSPDKYLVTTIARELTRD
jgi:hypothetical protein